MVACAVLAACWPGERVSGSSTTQENTIQGIAVLADGTPAVSASIRAHTGKIEVSSGAPAWKELDGTTADAKGAFALTVPDDTGFYLEIRERPMDTAHPDDFPEIFFTRLEKTIAGWKQLGTVRLATSGTLKGSLVDTSGKPPRALWLGVEGVPGLVSLGSQVDSTGTPFQLPGLAPGRHTLVLVSAEAAGTVAMRMDVFTAEVKAGTVTELGAIPFNTGGLSTGTGK